MRHGVYILTNTGHDKIKVGFTRRHVNTRLAELNRETSNPGIYTCEAFVQTEGDPKRLERQVHRYLTGRGKHSHKEYFNCTPYEAQRALMRFMHYDDDAVIKSAMSPQELRTLKHKNEKITGKAFLSENKQLAFKESGASQDDLSASALYIRGIVDCGERNIQPRLTVEATREEHMEMWQHYRDHHIPRLKVLYEEGKQEKSRDEIAGDIYIEIFPDHRPEGALSIPVFGKVTIRYSLVDRKKIKQLQERIRNTRQLTDYAEDYDLYRLEKLRPAALTRREEKRGLIDKNKMAEREKEIEQQVKSERTERNQKQFKREETIERTTIILTVAFFIGCMIFPLFL